MTGLTIHGTISTERQGDNTMEKFTKRDYFNRILAYAHDEDKPFILHELELLEKKNASRSAKPTKNQQANAELMNVIYDAMEDGKSYTVTDIHNAVPALAEFSGNKVSALVRGLRLDGRVIRTEVKGRAFFTKA